MERVNLEQAKEIIKGKKPSRDDFKDRISIKIKPSGANKIDLVKAKQTSKELIQKAKESVKERMDRQEREYLAKYSRPPIRGINADPGLESKKYMFAYNEKYYFIEVKSPEAKSMTKVAEADVADKLEDISEVKTYYLCSKYVCPIPVALKGLIKEAIKVKGDQGAIDKMNELTGMELTVKDL